MSHVLSKGCYDAQENRTTTSQKGRRMSSLGSFAALTAGAFAIAAVSFPSFAAGPRDHTVVTTEFSAENKPDDKNKKVVPKGAVQKQAPVHVAPRVIERHNGPPAGAQEEYRTAKEFRGEKENRSAEEDRGAQGYRRAEGHRHAEDHQAAENRG
jgi:hypothetical protein